MTKPIPQGPQLVGKLCGVSDSSLTKAKLYADYNHTELVVKYDAESNTYEDQDGCCWEFAYLAPNQGDEAIENMKSGV